MDLGVLSETFMQHAVLAAVLAGVSCACIGVAVVTMRLSFIGVCMSHAAFAGALLGLLIGMPPMWVAFPFSLLAAALIGPLADRAEFSPDTALGIIFSGTLGVSFVLVGLIPGPKAEALRLLWGSILTVGPASLVLLGASTLLVIALVIVFFKEIQAVIFDRRIATAVGVPAGAVFYTLLVVSGATITGALNVVGGLLVFSLIVNPAAAAYLLTYRLDRMFLIASAIGVASGLIGIAVSYWADLPSGASIVLVSTVLFAIAAALSPKRRARAAEAAP